MGTLFALEKSGAEMNSAGTLRVSSADREHAIMYSRQSILRKCTGRNGVYQTHITPQQASVATTAWNPLPCQDIQCSIDKKYNSS